LATYRLSTVYEQTPLRRRASGLALAVGVNLGLLLILATLGSFADKAKKASQALIVDFLPESHSADAPAKKTAAQAAARSATPAHRPPPPIIIPSKPTIAAPPPSPLQAPSPSPWIEMSKAELAAGNIANLPKSHGGSAGDSEVVGTGPHGETLYAAEWARHPTSTELGGYLPRNAPDGFGLIACRTVAGNRVEDCVELDQEPHGSHLASAVRQAAWQFRVRPPRKNGKPLIGSWVSIRIDYESRESGR
jgi:protein TonB